VVVLFFFARKTDLALGLVVGPLGEVFLDLHFRVFGLKGGNKIETIPLTYEIEFSCNN
jgi:hypothetical protein